MVLHGAPPDALNATVKHLRSGEVSGRLAVVTDLDTTLTALADPTRRQVVDLLRQAPRPAGELAASVAMSAPAMSRHLRVLRASGLVEVRSDDDDARLRVYRLRREPFTALQAWLDQVQAFWSEQLGAFKAHVEAQAAASPPGDPGPPGAGPPGDAGGGGRAGGAGGTGGTDDDRREGRA
jgi:DNA-binding transcriptional ArsR family regulator